MKKFIPTGRSRRLMAAMVVGAALSALGGEAKAATTGPAPDAVTDISRYCQVCWRNARLHPDSWSDCTQEVLVRLLQVSEAPLMGRMAPRANLHSARLSWVGADIRPIPDSRRRLAASTNRERRKSLRTLQGQFRLPRLSGNHHRVRCSAQMDSRANTFASPSSTNSLVALAGEQVQGLLAVLGVRGWR